MKKLWISAMIVLPAVVWMLAAAPEQRPSPEAAADWNELGPCGGDIRGIAVNPDNRRKLFAVSNSGQVFKTDNSGTLWTRTACLPDALYDIALSPSRPAVLYALGADALFRSEDGGETWTRRPYPSGGHGDEGRLAVHPKAPDTVFAAGNLRSGTSKWMAVFKTTNGGKSWSATKLAATSYNGASYCVAIDPLNPSTVFVGGGYDDTKKNYIFKSTDSGTTWSDFTGTAKGIPRDIIVDPTDSAKVYVTSWSGGGGFFQSSDGGKTWQGTSGDGFGLTMGLTLTNPRTFFTSVGADWIYKSIGGGNWTDIKTGFYGDSRRFAVVPGRLYLSSVSGVIKSDNGALTWTSNQGGIKATRIAAIAPALSSPNLLFTAAYEQGISKSVDAGRTWKLLWHIYGCESIPNLSVHPKNANRLIVILESG
ncbi:MAG: hypothetical protein MUQ00_01890 [Candidatus Aminicenantes bacterium]|nr:hypothetical protein [Candidatus Aminicenantes bacterium]